MINSKILRLTKTLDDYLPPAPRFEPKEAELLVVGGQKFALRDFPRLRGVFKVGVGLNTVPCEPTFI